ncbi:unnamed protein product [Ranitomeya imitator]|uniref:Uncharacterized protein n=1 Tax=Ranitomeya imitator TaxID=111125 RepID=A0ABN9MDI6_9NEOB|nr:unnamed protein product [Ranitomeya imitator]
MDEQGRFGKLTKNAIFILRPIKWLSVWANVLAKACICCGTNIDSFHKRTLLYMTQNKRLCFFVTNC